MLTTETNPRHRPRLVLCAAPLVAMGALIAALLSGCGSQTQPSTISIAPPAGSTTAGSTTAGSTTAAAPASGQSVTAKFPPAEVDKLRVIVADTLTKVSSGDQAGAQARITDLETLWDKDQATLQALDANAWNALDKQIDTALKAVRADAPDPSTETHALSTVMTTLQ